MLHDDNTLYSHPERPQAYQAAQGAILPERKSTQKAKFMLVVSRAVDDSGWMENDTKAVKTGLCHIASTSAAAGVVVTANKSSESSHSIDSRSNIFVFTL